MVSIVGCLMSCALVVSAAPSRLVHQTADVIAFAPECLPTSGTAAPASCAAPDRDHAGDQGTDDASIDVAATYATPLEVDCPSRGAAAPVHAAGDPAALSGGCDEPAFDFRYRVSRFADSERPNGALRPQSGGRPVRTTATCTGMPADTGTSLVSTALAPPIAIYATTRLAPPLEGKISFHADQWPATRVVEPLDRPPRE